MAPQEVNAENIETLNKYIFKFYIYDKIHILERIKTTLFINVMFKILATKFLQFLTYIDITIKQIYNDPWHLFLHTSSIHYIYQAPSAPYI